MRIRLFPLLVVASGLLLLVSPRASADTPNGAWTDPAPSAVYRDTPLAYLDEERPLQGWAEFEQGVSSVEFQLLQEEADEGGPCSAKEAVANQTVAGGGERVDFSFDAPFPCNGRYEVQAVAKPTQRPLRNDSDLVLDLWVAVAIPPAVTTGLKASELSGGDRAVELSWDAKDHEPDFKGYLVRRAIGDGDFVDLDEVGPKATSFTDHVVPREGGALRYKVIGMRPGPDGSTVFAAPGPTARATVAAYVPPTTEASSEGSGGGPGSSIAVTGNAAPRSVTRSIPRTSRTTIDTGFEEALPFQPGEPEPAQAPSTAPPAGGNTIATLANDDDDDTRRQTMLLIAGGTTTLSWALVLRYMTRRAITY